MVKNYERMRDEIVKILLQMDYHICFLLGDNGCGKTDIAEIVKNTDNSIRVFDNYVGQYCELPTDGKNIVITHRREILESADSIDSVILIYSDGLFSVCDVEDESTVQNMFHNLYYQKTSRKMILQRLLWNAISGVWSDYCEEYLQEFLKGEVRKSDNCILDVLRNYKEKTIWMN